MQTGWGRTGRFWGHDHFGVRPDILVTAKGLASGFPLSAIAASAELMAKAWPGSQGGTYGGNAVACAAAIATLDVIRDENLVDNAARVGAVLLGRLEKVAAERRASATSAASASCWAASSSPPTGSRTRHGAARPAGGRPSAGCCC